MTSPVGAGSGSNTQIQIAETQTDTYIKNKIKLAELDEKKSIAETFAEMLKGPARLIAKDTAQMWQS
jgi:spore germination protein GerM